MASFDHLLRAFDVRDQLDEIASADPPAYLRRCFAEGLSSPDLSLIRVQQITVCSMVLDSILHDRAYEPIEAELIADWRAHYATACMRMRETAIGALRRAAGLLRAFDAAAAAELEELERRLAPV